MAYNSNTGIITVDTSTTPYGGVSIADIQAAVGSSAKDIGGLIANGLINKWAKYKPVKKAGLDFANQRNSDFTWKTTADWWKGHNGQCGLTFQTYNNLGTNTIGSSGFFHELLAGNLGWGYEKPTGGVSQYPYRFFDFLQYSRYAPKPVEGVYDNLRLYGGGKLTVQLNETRAANSLGIQLGDLVISQSAVSGWYVGILIYKSASQYAYAFSENTLGGNGDLDVEFTGMTSYGGQSVTIVPFLSSVRWAQGGTETAGIFLSCDVAPETVSIAAEVQAVVTTIYAQWKDVLHGRVSYAVNIINNTYSPITVTNLKIALYDGYQDNDTDTVQSVTIPARSNQEYKGILFPISYDSSRTYTVVVTSNYSGVSGSEEVNEPRNPVNV